jgi:7-cyano-7-deazaguanine synthase in queuosine biosynthesis
MEIKVEFKTGRGQVLSNGMSICEISVPEINARQYLYLPFDDFHRYFGAPEGVAGDLLVVAGSCYIVDQLIPRSSFPDNWTRELEVRLPVAEPDRWNTIASELSETLNFLTGDLWQFSFHQRHGRIYKHRHRRLRRKRLRPASAICLFSGGLDSLVGAVDFLSKESGQLTLVGHYDLGSTAKTAQNNLASKLADCFPKRLSLFQARVGPVPNIPSNLGVYAQVSVPKTKETTLRSRSLVFLALGLYVAQRQRADKSVPLLIPENGFIALNPPLTHSRLGSCSTRTAHPLFLAHFQKVIQQLGIKNPLQNPLAEKTKGEVLAYSANPELIQHLVPDTISCAHPTRRQGWIRRNATHCGYCIPCIFRRAALHRIGLDQGETYGLDVCAGELALDENIASDLRAVLSWVYDAHIGDFTPETVVSRMALPPDAHSFAVRVLRTGIDEVTQLVKDKAAPHVQRWAGLV